MTGSRSGAMKAVVLLLVMGLTLTTADKAALQQFQHGNRLFTGAVYRELVKSSNGNILVSPFSVQTVLALTQSGARGQTGTEIRKALQLPNTSKRVEALYAELLPTIRPTNHQEYSLSTANKIYVKSGFGINKSFEDVATRNYAAAIESVEFSRQVQAAKTINDWVEEQTNHKIKDLVDPNSLTADTRLLLINALYFKAPWDIPFENFATTKRNFYVSASQVAKVDTMHVTDVFGYYDSSELNARYLELKYKGGEASMVIVLPNDKEGISALESQIDKVLEPPQFSNERVSVFLPKFLIEHTIPFNEILTTLGVNAAFSNGADLSAIAGAPGQLYISSVLQKTFINVTESGTEAAAATVVHAVLLSSVEIYPKEEIKIFEADHPFIFYIKTGNVTLFVGRHSSISEEK